MSDRHRQEVITEKTTHANAPSRLHSLAGPSRLSRPHDRGMS